MGKLQDFYKGTRLGGGEGYLGYGEGQWAPGANIRGGGDGRSGWMGRLADYNYMDEQRDISGRRRMDATDVQERHKLSDVNPQGVYGDYGEGGFTRDDLIEQDRRRGVDQKISDKRFGDEYRESDEGRRSQPNNMLQWAMSKLPGGGDNVNNQPDLTEEEMREMDYGRTISGLYTGGQKKYLGVDNEYYPTSSRGGGWNDGYEQRPGKNRQEGGW